MDYLGSLSPRQLTLLFDVERTEEGYPKIVPPPAGRAPTAEELFRRRCFLNAVTDPAAVDRLWAAEKGRREKAAADALAKKKPRKTRGPGGKGGPP